MKESPSTLNLSPFNRILILALISAVAISIYLFFGKNDGTRSTIGNEALIHMEASVQKSHHFKKYINAQIRLLEESKNMNSNVGIWGNTADMFLITLNNYVSDIDYFIQSYSNPSIKVEKKYLENRIRTFELWAENASRMVKENQSLIKKVKTISVLESKIDSLEDVLSNESKLAILGKAKEMEIRSELRKYQTQVEALKQQGVLLKSKYDSLNQELSNKNKDIDSLKRLIDEARMAYQVLENSSAKNALLATKINLWYFVGDKRVKQERRALTSNKADYNKGKEVMTVYGEFSLSHETYVPFKVATVYLYKVENNQRVELARVKVTVRNQLSGEFSLIPTSRLGKGKYVVEVIYNEKQVIDSQFFITH